jgi:hypothetical protein
MTPPQLNWQRPGQQLQLNGLASHTGWYLQAQTNAPGAGIRTAWATVSSSNTTNAASFPVNSTRAAHFLG